MKYLKWFVFCIFPALLLSSCYSSKNVAYFQDLTDTSKIYSQVIASTYEVKIAPDDILQIIINSINPEATAVFNLGNTSPSLVSQSQTLQSGTGVIVNPNTEGDRSSITKGYLVDKTGSIDFPVLGKLKVSGLTITQLKDTLKDKLNNYLKDPIINVRLLNYKITVLGEVLRPSTYSIPSERITVVDAIGMAGDLTIYGRRENVLLVREENGKRSFVRLNLNSTNIFESPYFYLKQNDVIYIEPNKARIVGSDATAIRYISLITAGLTLLIVIASRAN